jgi:hypothetical protein
MSSVPGVYGSGFLSRKHLKRAIKYGSYYGAAPVVSAPVDHIQWGHVSASGPMVHQPLRTSRYYSKGGYQSSHHTDHYHLGEHLHSSEVYGSAYLSRKHLKRAIKYGSWYCSASVVRAPVDHIQWGHVSAPGPMVHQPLRTSRYYSKGGYQSSHHTDHYHLGEHLLHGSRNTAPAAAPVVQSVKKVIKVHLAYPDSSKDETVELPDDATGLTVKEYVRDSTGVEVGRLMVSARQGAKLVRNDELLSSNPRFLKLQISSPLLPKPPLPPLPPRVPTWRLPSRRWEREHLNNNQRCKICEMLVTNECPNCEMQIALRPRYSCIVSLIFVPPFAAHFSSSPFRRVSTCITS